MKYFCIKPLKTKDIMGIPQCFEIGCLVSIYEYFGGRYFIKVSFDNYPEIIWCQIESNDIDIYFTEITKFRENKINLLGIL